ncbi:glycosyltransferase family 4 protein [Brachybacterium sp. GCM10030267]|uniref:glycosyltransferase family 4 protein n=1 Tax=Brachybacterium sp. GCM10030267 TaxID=3273381 RepID=UPI003610EC39
MGQSMVEHAFADPALLAVQISRRLPLGARMLMGGVLESASAALPSVAALGAVMAGDMLNARRLVGEVLEAGRPSRLAGEIAILLNRTDLVGDTAPARTRARAAWSRGDLEGALQILRDACLNGDGYALLLRSELDLLRTGRRLPLAAGLSLPDRSSTNAKPAPFEGLRVLHVVTNSLPHTQSGYTLRTHRILRALTDAGVRSMALTRTGYPVMVGKVGAAREDSVDGINYRRTLPLFLARTPEQRLLQQVHEALAVVREFRPDIIHTTTDYRNALVGQAVARATGLPWILEARGLMEKTWVASQFSESARAEAKRSQRARLIAAREGELARSADAVVTLSRTMAGEFVARGVEPGAITIIPNGVDAELLERHLSPAEARRSVALDRSDAFVVGAVSALVDYEGFDTLLRAAAEIVHGRCGRPELWEKLVVVLAGDGTAAPGLSSLARSLGISDRVVLPGRVPRRSARDWVQALDAVVVPRRDVEVARFVTPQKPVEALALGRPVIISDLPALRETITAEDGTSCGIVVPPDDHVALAGAIARLHDDPGMTVGLVEAGRCLAAERTWPSLVRRYSDAYARAMTRRDERRTG